MSVHSQKDGMTKSVIESRKTMPDKELIQVMLNLLCSPRLPEIDLKIKQQLADDPAFQELFSYIMSLRELSFALYNGDLQLCIEGKGFILSNLKALQSNLRHLTWQAKQVTKGDFSQKVEFLGEFSEAFNEMTSNLNEINGQLQKLASMDSLTQLYNRKALDQFLEQAFVQSKEQDCDLSILMFDIDHFKQVNDQYGHQIGDQVLIQISEVLKKQFRAGDMVARYGGEEFIAVQQKTSSDQAVKIGERVLQSVKNSVFQTDDGQRFSVTVSMGVSSIIPTDRSFEEIIKRSDDALYEAKNSGRNRLCVALGDKK